jgi:hypothetical protein
MLLPKVSVQWSGAGAVYSGSLRVYEFSPEATLVTTGYSGYLGMKSAVFWGITLRDTVPTDTVSRNVGKQLPHDAA